ncbi:flagellar basal body M-ring protein FliF [Noviherbaspirillum cavernae]|uniref:Flagellar M-ring protein n=1 Tax=Noviherbaspirillum cavernae TaxID=2320862 RepID=A0A418X6A0_9BURK|nr:flagellar basal-body MS-ring/collar protein FliF [Noviherbaspirillum cavernae]RJG07916.1 flagellar basal body M-ring protein FliF [Noviherbaspirillum cavernae]
MRFAPQTPGGRNALLMGAVAAIAALIAGVWMWGQKPEYRVLFSNFSDRDGGAIVAALQQMNVPYKYAEGGGAILVPDDKVHDVRLKLASQGLPKGGSVGFELMENQKLGVSQFHEQVNFQRALEGELARSIQSVAAVQTARVHLALPKSSVFVRDQQKPTVSVLLNLHPGRMLDAQQVSAIVHLVASSVPDLPIKNVTVVDQSGNLLSENGKTPASNGLDPTQLKYVQELQQSIVRRVESIITPIVGQNNVRAEATADVDFSTSEQAAEMYKPNQTPNSATVRSQHNSEAQNGGNNNAGVPGALTNQPPAPSTAPVVNPQGAAGTAMNPPGTGAAGSSQRDSTVNYEVDKTIRYVQQPMGGIKRLTVAVVVNYKRVTGKDGKVTTRPLTDAEKTEITDLVKEAMGFNKDRGDSLNVVNSPFAGMEKEELPEVPLWKQPEMHSLAKEVGRYLLLALVVLLLYFKVLKPLIYKDEKKDEEKDPELLEAPELDENGNPIVKELGEGEDALLLEDDDDDDPTKPQMMTYAKRLEAAKKLAKENPKVVANVIKEWIAE